MRHILLTLSKDQMEKIECQTWDLLLEVYKETQVIPPIDINKVIEHSGLSLRVGSFKDPTTEGAYDQKRKIIYVERNAPYERQVFTVAHELGHFYLHQSKPIEVFYRKDLPGFDEDDSTEEQEANWFAASLLMPRNLLKVISNLTNDTTEISRRFSVSSSAAYYRLKNLGYLD